MTKSVYQWKPRTKFEIDPQVAGEELEKIRGHNSGDLSPEAVIKAAEDKSSPLHSLFEWDDAKAARLQRLSMANTLIRSIHVTVTSSGPQEIKTVDVTVTNVTPARGGEVHVVSEAELRQQRVERGWSELDKWLKQYGALPEFAQVAGVVQVLTAQRQNKAA